MQSDVSSRVQVERLISGVVARLGGIVVLVNNAGIQRYGGCLGVASLRKAKPFRKSGGGAARPLNLNPM